MISHDKKDKKKQITPTYSSSISDSVNRCWHLTFLPSSLTNWRTKKITTKEKNTYSSKKSKDYCWNREHFRIWWKFSSDCKITSLLELHKILANCVLSVMAVLTFLNDVTIESGTAWQNIGETIRIQQIGIQKNLTPFSVLANNRYCKKFKNKCCRKCYHKISSKGATPYSHIFSDIVYISISFKS